MDCYAKLQNQECLVSKNLVCAIKNFRHGTRLCKVLVSKICAEGKTECFSLRSRIETGWKFSAKIRAEENEEILDKFKDNSYT